MRYAQITDRLSDLGGKKWAVHQAARNRVADGDAIIELAIGEPDIPVDPQLVEVCAEAMRKGRTRYSSGRGEDTLLNALVAKYQVRYPGVSTTNFLCFPGTQTALYVALTGLVDLGDGVLVGDPYYATYEGVIRSSGASLQPVPLFMENGFVMQADDLRAAVNEKSRVLLLNTPHNPTGAVFSRETLIGLGDIAIEHNLWIVCDEVYEDLVFNGSFSSPLEIEALRARTIVASSISKSYAAPGFRSGWCLGPEEFCERLLPISETILFGNQPFIADMTAHALLSDCETPSQMRESLSTRAELVFDIVAQCQALKITKAEGGMFIMIDVSATGMNGEQFAWALLDQKDVSVMPGSSFGENAKSLIRVALTVPEEELCEAASRICALADQTVKAS